MNSWWVDAGADRDLAVERGSQDIILNILTTTGLAQRYVGEWARTAVGSASSCAPAACGSALRRTPGTRCGSPGPVTGVEDGQVTVDVVGAVPLGNHVNAKGVLA